jgi:hypothetical protein
MNKLDTLLEQLDSVPEDGVVRGREGFRIEYGSICADAKTAINYLVRHTYNLQQENKRLKQGTKLLVKAINDFERHLNL